MDYRNTIKVKTNQEDVFRAISVEIEKWWGKTDNPVYQVGDEFSIFFGTTEWRFLITEFSKYDQITWRCIKAHHIVDGLPGIEEEWLNTEIYWKLRAIGEYVEVSFLHKGLNPELKCYSVCEPGWNFFISTSLKNYLETGQGSPRFYE